MMLYNQALVTVSSPLHRNEKKHKVWTAAEHIMVELSFELC